MIYYIIVIVKSSKRGLKEGIEKDKSVEGFFCLGKNPMDEESGSSTMEPWTLDKLQAFLAYCRLRNPVLTKSASQILGAYYKWQRRNEENQVGGRTTVRMLQSLIRYFAAKEILPFLAIFQKKLTASFCCYLIFLNK